MSSHTPGPWEVATERRDGVTPAPMDYLGLDSPTYEIRGQGPYWIAHTLRLEDARLIAAAPEMRELLEPAAQSCRHAGNFALAAAIDELLNKIKG